VRVGAIAGALAAVALGSVVAYGWGTPGTQLQAVGLGIMVAGTVGLAGVLVRTLIGLRRPRRTRRPEPVALLVPAPAPAPEQIRRSAHVEVPPTTALRSSSAASRRFAGYGAAD
jgi:hypothetical protein